MLELVARTRWLAWLAAVSLAFLLVLRMQVAQPAHGMVRHGHAERGDHQEASQRPPKVWLNPSALPAVARKGNATALSSRPVILAYYAGDDAARQSIQRYGRHVTLAVEAEYALDASGNVVPGSGAGAVTGLWNRSQTAVLAMFSLHDGKQARRLLSSPAARTRAVRNMVRVARARGLDGVNINLEGMDPSLRDEHSALAAELYREARARGMLSTVTVAATADGNPGHGWSGAYDYQALARAADYIVIMGYDQHWPGGPPGPVGSLDWLDRVAAYAARTAGPQKVILALPAYGYAWPLDGDGRARGLYASYAHKLAQRSGARYVPDTGEATFTYDDGGTVRVTWYTPPQGIRAKLGVALRHGLAGIGIWMMGYEAEYYWNAILGYARAMQQQLARANRGSPE